MTNLPVNLPQCICIHFHDFAIVGHQSIDFRFHISCLSIYSTTQLLLSAPKGGSLEHLYYGSRTSDTDIHGIYETTHGVDAYPAYGMKYPGETALSVCHADGNLTLQMFQTAALR